VTVELVEVRQQILAAPRVHQRMKPRQHQDARRRRPRRFVVDDQHPQRRLAPGLDREIELGPELALKLFARGDRGPAHRRPGQARARAGGPVELAPREGTPEPGRRPGAHVEEAIPRARDAIRLDRPVALDDEHGVVVAPDALPAGMVRQQHEIGPTQGQAAHVSIQRGHEAGL